MKHVFIEETLQLLDTSGSGVPANRTSLSQSFKTGQFYSLQLREVIATSVSDQHSVHPPF
jgi:hypothetical protein